uniref:Uncharacterized protein AlNc14C58G4329 n=1 Tax=Albugo laibachii Nc14 TaxID=890382 RepID=F0WCE9_9STRA|nr:hypothetical protein PITG_16835 [Albugo laibachii Nc14]|eukprot:CCA18864.1 hypothetical protein PITG_16835 [Albugo laibachii Nc14]
MEASQAEKKRLNGHEASVLGLLFIQGDNTMSREALVVRPPRCVPPGASPNTKFGVQQRGYTDTVANVEMAVPQHLVPPPVYQPATPQKFSPGPHSGLMPDTRQRKLGIRQLNLWEFCQEVTSFSIPWGQRFVRQAVELAHFAQSTEIKLRERVERDVVSNVQADKSDVRKCYKCKNLGHLKLAFFDIKKGSFKSEEADFVIAVQRTNAEEGVWVLESGSRRHLANNVDLLEAQIIV